MAKQYRVLRFNHAMALVGGPLLVFSDRNLYHYQLNCSHFHCCLTEKRAERKPWQERNGKKIKEKKEAVSWELVNLKWKQRRNR